MDDIAASKDVKRLPPFAGGALLINACSLEPASGGGLGRWVLAASSVLLPRALPPLNSNA